MNRHTTCVLTALTSLSFLFSTITATQAAPLVVPTTLDYLLVGRGDSATAVGVKVSSSESLGRIYEVPSSSFPDVDDDPPWPIPANGTPPDPNTITNDGNVAVTHVNGTYDFSGVDIWADTGVRCVDNVTDTNTSGGGCRAGWSSSTLTNGTFADDPNAMATIESELDAAKATIMGLSGTNAWSLSGSGTKNGAGRWVLSDGKVSTDTTITLGPGQNVIEIDTNENKFLLENSGLVIDGPTGSSVIFLLVDQAEDYDFTNASITIGSGGIKENATLFAVLDGGNGSNFLFSKVIVNGAAFWDLSKDGGSITMNNVQGCGQWVGDHLNFNNVQLSLCAHGVPEPSSVILLAATPLTMLTRRRE